MSRQKRARRNKLNNAGLKQNYKSKTSPSAVKARDRRRQEIDIGHLYPRRHRKRTDLKARLADELGLPHNTRFIFRRSSDFDDEIDRPIRKLSFGTVVVINRDDLTLVLIVRFSLWKEMWPSLKHQFAHSITTTLQHARARLRCKCHNSVQTFEEDHVYWGWMGCCGWRPGTDDGRSFGQLSKHIFFLHTLKCKPNLDIDKQLISFFFPFPPNRLLRIQ